MQRWHHYAEYQQFLQGIIQPLLAAEEERQRQAELARQRAEEEKERQRQAELARWRAKAEKERQRQAELARQRAEEEEKERQRQAEIARKRAEAERERQRQAELARKRAEAERERQRRAEEEREKAEWEARKLPAFGCLILSGILLTGFVSSHIHLDLGGKILFFLISFFLIVCFLSLFEELDSTAMFYLYLSIMLSLISQYLLFGNFAGFNIFVASFFFIGYFLISVFIIFLILGYITKR